MIRFLVCIILCAGCFAGCDSPGNMFGSRPILTVSKNNLRLAGRVERVERKSGYVLIRRFGAWRYNVTDEVVESHGMDRTANLLPTEESLGEHVAADIRSGDVQVGDAVFIKKIKTVQNTKLSP
jgi:hypothetical protein